MKIKRLEIVGFKSFVNRTVVDFDHNITAIVGPNGCGKSNVVDAIKWVMGEQSAKMLRGGSMTDVIFNGSESMGPAQSAEVSLTFDNTDGLTPPEYAQYAEITVTRRLHRDGRSDYIINKQPVRLMDVTNLFLGTGVGRRAYSTIEQGRIGFIVSSKPEDRRHMIEEAAGITKFKVRKKTAERKMEQTRENLQRLSDLASGLERNVASLKRQAQKAERYLEYMKELESLELYVAAFRYLELFTEQKHLLRAAEHTAATLEGKRFGLVHLEAESEAERASIEALSREVERAQALAYEMNNQVRVLEGRIEAAESRRRALDEREGMAARELEELAAQRERLAAERDRLLESLDELALAEDSTQGLVDAEADAAEELKIAATEAERRLHALRERASEIRMRIARADSALKGTLRRREESAGRKERLAMERAELEARVADAEQEREELAARLEGLRGGKEDTAERRAAVEAELKGLRDELEAAVRTVDGLRDEVSQKRSRLRSLQEIEARFEGVGAGVRALMTRFGESPAARAERGVLGLLADRIECPTELTRALAGALGPRLENVVVRDAEASLEAVRFLREGSRGRATVVPLTARVSQTASSVPEGEGVRGRLADLLRTDDETRAVLEALAGHFVVVDSLEVATSLRARHPDVGFVTLEGDVVESTGALTGGAGDDGHAHMVKVKREIRELTDAVAELGARFDAAEARRNELRTRIAGLEAELDAARAAAQDTAVAVVAVEKDLRAVEDELARARKRLEDVELESRELDEGLGMVDDEESEARADLEDAREEELSLEAEIEAAEQDYEEKRERVEEQASRLTEVRVRAAQARQRAESERMALDRLEHAALELDHRERRLRGDVENSDIERVRIAGEIFRARDDLDNAVEVAMRAKRAAEELRAKFEEARAGIGTNDAEIKELRASIERLTNEHNTQKLRLREIEMNLEHLVGGVQEKYGKDIRKHLVDFHARELPDAATLTRIDELTKLVQRMGPVNLTAIEEFEAENTRLEEIERQKKDLLDSLAHLEKAIRQMNRESRELFKEAFIGINERFKRVFPTLFRGGKAELKLTDPNDLLTTGVDIEAQPPGKRLGSLELMSGGEKALTAVAFIFAIFQYKPSPFCILDEVDAPLDEANVARFAEAISQMTDHSQFIVITHSKRTMEYADVLYGVTMERPGVSSLIAVELRGDRRPVPERVAAA
ncbi:MAG: chromosome segregation protein SMC [Myxococcales bacterium]|nr:chromosome segregation protein SMC [Myxococcales bacterium]